MSLAAMKRKQKHTRGIPINHARDWSSPLYNVGYGGNKHIKDQNHSISYRQYTNNLRLGRQCKNGDCHREIVLDPYKKTLFADKSADHRVEVLNTHHLKETNVEKLKHKHKIALDGCKNHTLNIIGDDSDSVRTAEHVLNKRKACLIGKPSEIEEIEEIEDSLFFVITGRGSILANMGVEIFVKLNGIDDLKKLDVKDASDGATSTAGIASIDILFKSNGKQINKSNIDYYILKLIPTEDSVNTQRFNGEARETKLVLEYFAKIDPPQMNSADISDGLQIGGGVDAGDADFEITPITNLIYTLFTIVGIGGLIDSIRAILGPDINEQKLKLGLNGQQAELEIDNKKRIAMFDLILKKAEVMGTGFWKDDDGSIAALLTDIGSTLLDTYILNLDDTSPIRSTIHEELQTIYHILDISADKLESEDIDDDDWDDIINTISQIIVNEGYLYEGSIKTEIYDATSGRFPETNIFDVSTDFGFLDRGDGSGATNVDYGWD